MRKHSRTQRYKLHRNPTQLKVFSNLSFFLFSNSFSLFYSRDNFFFFVSTAYCVVSKYCVSHCLCSRFGVTRDFIVASAVAYNQ